MKFKVFCVAAMLALGAGGAAWSQQRPGGNGPLPGDPGTGGGGGGNWNAPQPYDAPPRPYPHFESSYELTFGAMAKSADDRQFTFSVGRYTAGEAAAEATATCRSASGQACTVVRGFQNQCATLAWPASRGRQAGLLSEAAMAVETTSVDSRRVALAGCEKIYGEQCRIGYMACASPTRKTDLAMDRWSAVAIDPASLKVFAAIGGGYNAASARAAAYDACQRAAGTRGDCKVLDDFGPGQCRSLARSEAAIADGEYAAIVRERPDPAVALKQCREKAGSACKVVWQACS